MDRLPIIDLTDDRLPAVVELCRTALDLPEDAAEAAEMVSRLRSADPRSSVGFVALGGEDRVIGVALASLSHRDASIGHIDLVVVHPAERRKGVCRQLVGRVEAALAELRAVDVVLAGNPPYYAWPGIDVRYTPAVCAALALGFQQDQTAWNMTADLRQPLSTEADEKRLTGVTVRRAESSDLPLLADFALSVHNAGWSDEIAHSIGEAKAGCWIAVGDDGTLFGFAAYGSSRPSWFGPMGTSPAARGRGIGSVLLRRCLDEQRKAGHDTVQIGWVGPVPFYSAAVGARIERVFLLYRKSL